MQVSCWSLQLDGLFQVWELWWAQNPCSGELLVVLSIGHVQPCFGWWCQFMHFFPPNPLHTTFLFRTHLYQGLSLSKVPLAIVALSKFDPSLFSLSKLPLFNFSPSNLPVMFVLSFIYVLSSFVWQNLYFCPSSSYPIVFSVLTARRLDMWGYLVL